MRSWKSVNLALIAVAVGCGPPDPFPLETGRKWSYSVRGGLSSRVESIRVVGPIAVDGRPGWRLAGSLGVAAMAWTPDALVAEQVPGTRFSPALPILYRSPERAATWRGMITWMNGVAEAGADIAQEPVTIDIGGRKMKVTQVRHRFTMPNGLSELVSWYAPGIGLVRQQQRDGDRLVRSLEWLSGP